MKKVVKQGEIIPRGYGIAYMDCQRNVYITYPIPINFVVALWLKFYRWLVRCGGLFVFSSKETVIARGKLDFDVNEGAIINNKPLYDIITERHKGKTIEVIVREVSK